MQRLALSISLSFVLLTSNTALAVNETKRFIGALAGFLDQGTLGDFELQTMLEACAKNTIVNPFAQSADLGSPQFFANEAFEQYFETGIELDVDPICKWVKTAFASKHGEHKERAEVADETQKLWSVQHHFAIALGDRHTCLILEDQTVRCFGANDKGQSTPPPDLGPVVSLSAAGDYTCAIKIDGQYRCFGDDEGGLTRPAKAGSPAIVSMSSGPFANCTLDSHNVALCWGTDADFDVPPHVGPLQSVSVGNSVVCAVTLNGFVQCWGDDKSPSIKVPANLLGVARSVSVGFNHACAVTAEGFVECWGANSYGQGIVPPGLGRVRSISAGNYHNCAVTDEGLARCWGSKDEGRCDVPPDLGPVHYVVAGEFNSCAVKTDGRVKCWGLDEGHVSGPEGIKVLDVMPH